MDRFTRILELHKLLSSCRRPISRTDIEYYLECSRATAHRCIRDLRDYLNAPVSYDYEHRGYYYDEQDGRFELPGLWFTPAEIQSLALLDQLIEGLSPGLLRSHLSPVARRIDWLLNHETALGTADIRRRMQLLPLGRRDIDNSAFASVVESLLRRRQIEIRYHGRTRDAVTERTISPQRLNYYRHNWYLDAWCHTRQALRIFAVERIAPLAVLDGDAIEVSEEQLDAQLTGAYGIFTGQPTRQARLRFSVHAARWVADEQWHPDQQSRWLEDGRYELLIPYQDATELTMDILRHGPNCEVIAPLELREAVTERLQQTLGVYK